MSAPINGGDPGFPEPGPLLQSPPLDRFCDLVLTGGVASGVVYPWAIVKLARSFRFKNIGGTSVGAMAAAVTAAAEYSRRYGSDLGFEILRQMPRTLAEERRPGVTKMLSLFQPAPRGRRLFAVFLGALREFYVAAGSTPEPAAGGVPASHSRPRWRETVRSVGSPGSSSLIRLGMIVAQIYRREAIIGALIAAVAVAGVLAIAISWGSRGWAPWLFAVMALASTGAIAAMAAVVRAVVADFRAGIIDNDLGLCRGGAERGAPEGDDALVEWLHEAIQRAAGLEKDGKPLTFADLWHAPLVPGGPPNHGNYSRRSDERSINLEMITTNVTHGRPYLLPLRDELSRLFFREDELRHFFPESVMQYLRRVSKPYRPREPADPPVTAEWANLRELPGAEMPIVVAARLSLSYPVLFSSPPLYAIDYEQPDGNHRQPRLCRFSDGGLCSNFPVHLFDAAIPRWPTFGMWLDEEGPYEKAAVWLPPSPSDGRRDGWYLEPLEPERGDTMWGFFRFLRAGFMAAKDWKDRYGLRMPQVRNRVARLYLRRGEGELNIAMSGRSILEMAHRYGSEAGRQFVERFLADSAADAPAQHWRDHLSIRFRLLLFTLEERLIGLTSEAAGGPHSMSIDELIDADRLLVLSEEEQRQLGEEEARKVVGARKELLHQLLQALRELELTFATQTVPLPYQPSPTPALRMRTPV